MIYVYDGSWDGLMCLVYRTAEDGCVPEDILRSEAAEQGILFATTQICNDPGTAEATSAVLKKRVSRLMLSDIWRALLSEDEGVDMALWRTLANIWRLGEKAEMDLADESIFAVRRASMKTGREYEKYLGLVRFKDVGGLFYAELEPECDVIALLARHFSDRLSDKGWVLHDLRRRRAAIYDTKRWVIADMDLPQAPSATAEEKAYQELWKEFYRSTTTRERLNYRVQRGHMPKKYWKHLVENPGEFHGKA